MRRAHTEVFVARLAVEADTSKQPFVISNIPVMIPFEREVSMPILPSKFVKGTNVPSEERTSVIMKNITIYPPTRREDVTADIMVSVKTSSLFLF